MKFILLLLLLGIMTPLKSQRDPWEPYNNSDKGKQNPMPVVPEPSTYGAIFTGSSLLLVWYARQRKRK